MTSHPPYSRAKLHRGGVGPAPIMLRTAEGALVRSPEATRSRITGEAEISHSCHTLAPFTRSGATPSEAVGQVSRNPGLAYCLHYDQ